VSLNQFTRVCVACEVELRPKQNGVLLVEAATFGFMSLRQADIWHCPVCLHETVIGVADQELFGHWEGDIMAEIRRREVRGQRVVLCWLNQREKEEFLRRGKEAEEKARVGL
jgi:hypothetical protein